MTLYLFNGFEFDSETSQLHKADQLIPLRPRVATLLQHFLENKDLVLTKDELLNKIRHGTYTSESVLFQNISELRRLLGAGPREPGNILNIKKKGYRWCTPVETKPSPPPPPSSPHLAPVEPIPALPPVSKTAIAPAQSESKPEAETETETETEPKTVSFRLIWTLRAVFVLLLLAFAFQFWLKQKNSNRPQRFVLLPFTNKTGDPKDDWVELGMMNTVVTLVNETSLMTLPTARENPPELAFLEGRTPGFQTLSRLLKALELDALVTTRVEKCPEGYALVYNYITPTVESTNRVVGATLQDCASAMSRTLSWAKRDGAVSSNYTLSANHEAARSFGMAMQSRHHGQLQAADLFFTHALTLEPSMTWARIYRARCLNELGQLGLAEQITRQALKEATQAGHQPQIEQCLTNLAQIAARNNQPQQEISFLSTIVANGKDRADLRARLRAQHTLALALQQNGAMEEARKYYLANLQLSLKFAYYQGTAAAHHALAKLDYLAGAFKSATEHNEIALSLYRSLGNEWRESEVLAHQGQVYEGLGNKSEARRFHRNAFYHADFVYHHECVIEATSNFGASFEEASDWEQALIWYHKALEVCYESHSPATNTTNFKLAEVYLKAGRPLEGLIYLNTYRDKFDESSTFSQNLWVSTEDYQRLADLYQTTLPKANQ